MSSLPGALPTVLNSLCTLGQTFLSKESKGL